MGVEEIVCNISVVFFETQCRTAAAVISIAVNFLVHHRRHRHTCNSKQVLMACHVAFTGQ